MSTCTFQSSVVYVYVYVNMFILYILMLQTLTLLHSTNILFNPRWSGGPRLPGAVLPRSMPPCDSV